MKVCTFNIMMNDIFFSERLFLLIQMIKLNNIDIICLQEVCQVSLQQLLKISNYKIYHKSSCQYFNIIMVKTDIVVACHSIVKLNSKMGRTLNHLQILFNDKIYNIITFHLESLNCKKIRSQQIIEMWRFTSKLDNVICCGDTNQRVDENSHIPENFNDAWLQTQQTCGEHTYYASRYFGKSNKERYDKVYYSNDLELKSFGIVGDKCINNIYISDHDGIIVKVE